MARLFRSEPLLYLASRKFREAADFAKLAGDEGDAAEDVENAIEAKEVWDRTAATIKAETEAKVAAAMAKAKADAARARKLAHDYRERALKDYRDGRTLESLINKATVKTKMFLSALVKEGMEERQKLLEEYQGKEKYLRMAADKFFDAATCSIRAGDEETAQADYYSAAETVDQLHGITSKDLGARHACLQAAARLKGPLKEKVRALAARPKSRREAPPDPKVTYEMLVAEWKKARETPGTEHFTARFRYFDVVINGKSVSFPGAELPEGLALKAVALGASPEEAHQVVRTRWGEKGEASIPAGTYYRGGQVTDPSSSPLYEKYDPSKAISPGSPEMRRFLEK